MTWAKTHLGQTLSLVHWNGQFRNGLTGEDVHFPPQELLLELWDQLKATNAVCAWSFLDSTQTDILSFAEHCLLFATIVYGEDEPKADQIPKTIVGCLYLAKTVRLQEASIGIVLAPQYMGRGIGPVALRIAIAYAIDVLNFHRLTATVMDVSDSERAISVFKRLGFVHEGTHRMASYCPLTGEWKDEIHLALVDLDWVCRGSHRTPSQAAGKAATWKKSPWEQMVERHEEEVEEMIQRTESQFRIRKARSTDTLRHSSKSEVKLEEFSMTDDGEYTSDDAHLPNLDFKQIKSEPFVSTSSSFEDMQHRAIAVKKDEDFSEDESIGGSSGWEITDGYSSADNLLQSSDQEDM